MKSSGGFSCDGKVMLQKLREVCERSRADFDEQKTVMYEYLIGNTMFTCEFRADAMEITMSPDAAIEGDKECLARTHDRAILYEPGFIFAHSGGLIALSYKGAGDKREVVTTKACRAMKKDDPGLGARVCSLYIFKKS